MDNRKPDETHDGGMKASQSKVDKPSDVAGGHAVGLQTPKKSDTMATHAEVAQRTPKGRLTGSNPSTPKSSTGRTPKVTAKARESSTGAIPKAPESSTGAIPKAPDSSTGAIPKTPRTAAGANLQTPTETDDEMKRKGIKMFDSMYDVEDRATIEDDCTLADDGEEEDSLESDDEADDDNGLACGGLPTGKTVESITNDLKRCTVDAEKPELEYFLKSDEYFSSHAGSKATTSDKTLDVLEIPRFEQDKISQLLAERCTPDLHTLNIEEIMAKYEKEFPLWMIILNEGFNVLLHGMGSKYVLMDAFLRKQLTNRHVVEVNGYFPPLTVKDVLDAIANDVLKLSLGASNTHDAIGTIERKLRSSPSTHLFLLVHNMDGEPLRNDRMKMVLCRLAALQNVHIVASIDTVSAPLLWSTSELFLLNFAWRNVTTMLTYDKETAFESSLLVENSDKVAFSSMRSVFSSLTSNARGIFMAVVRYQLANGGPKNPNYNGMLLKDLYRLSREAFYVSNEVALRAHLTEFIDHMLLRGKRTPDGAETLLIPLEYELLQRFEEKESNN